MTPDILINGISMAGLGWVRESIDFPAPEPQMETITVPGRNSPIRYTEALGRHGGLCDGRQGQGDHGHLPGRHGDTDITE